MKKLDKNKLCLRKEAIRVLQHTMLENARGGVPNSEAIICTTDSLTPCTKPSVRNCVTAP
jgi:hypothetical protein